MNTKKNKKKYNKDDEFYEFFMEDLELKRAEDKIKKERERMLIVKKWILSREKLLNVRT